MAFLMNDVTLHLGDCLSVLKGMESGSVDAVVTDPPYFKVKDEAWDRQWDNSAEFLEWISQLCGEWWRLLKPNGSLYVFAYPRMAAAVEVEIGKQFNVLNRITWQKENGWARRQCKEEQRAFFPSSEAIIFAEHYGADNAAKGEAGYAAKFVFEPLRKYLADEFRALSWNADDLNRICGTANMAGRHYTARSQWCLPTAEHYAKLQAAADGHLRREYEDLRREYEDLRRPFFVTKDVPHTDVWNFPTVPPGPRKHPCEKPVPLMRHIIETSTRPDAVVLDCFAGHGTTGVACVQTGRRFIGIEIDPTYFAIAEKRIAAERIQSDTTHERLDTTK